MIILSLIIIFIIFVLYKFGTFNNYLPASMASASATKEGYAGSYTEGELRCVSHGGRCPTAPGYN